MNNWIIKSFMFYSLFLLLLLLLLSIFPEHIINFFPKSNYLKNQLITKGGNQYLKAVFFESQEKNKNNMPQEFILFYLLSMVSTSQSNAFARPCAFSLVSQPWHDFITLRFLPPPLCVPFWVLLPLPFCLFAAYGFCGSFAARTRAPPDTSTKWKQDENFGFNKHTHNMLQESRRGRRLSRSRHRSWRTEKLL